MPSYVNHHDSTDKTSSESMVLMKTKYKVVINPDNCLCRGCVFDGFDNRCIKPHGQTPSCVVNSSYGVHMGIIVVDKGES